MALFRKSLSNRLQLRLKLFELFRLLSSLLKFFWQARVADLAKESHLKLRISPPSSLLLWLSQTVSKPDSNCKNDFMSASICQIIMFVNGTC